MTGRRPANSFVGSKSARNNEARRLEELMLRLRAASSYRVLEQRMVFDGAAADTANQIADSAPPPAGDAAAGAPDAGDVVSALASAPVDAASEPTNEIYFVDDAIENVDSLLAGIPTGAEIVVLDSASSGLAQIASYLANRTGIDAIHLVSHGEAGAIHLGSDTLDAANIDAHAVALAAIGTALSADADILIYGCDVASGSEGEAFVSRLAALTGADVAASDDDTGAAALDADWDLEHHVGLVESDGLVIAGWTGVLAPTSATLDWQTVGNHTFGATGTTYTVGGLTNAVTIRTTGTGSIVNDTTFATGGTGDPGLGLQASTSSTTSGQTTEIVFNSSALPLGVKTVAFDIRNIDAAALWDDRIIVQAYDRNGTLLSSANITATPRQTSGQTYSISSPTNAKQFDGNIDGASDNAAYDSVGLSIASTTGADIARVTILYVSGTSGTSTGAIVLSDIAFTYNLAPVATNDSFTTQHDTAVGINVRANDTDANSDTLSVTAVDGTAIVAGGPGVAVTGGVVTLNTGGNLVFTPTANFAGTTSFTYTVSDGFGGQATATVNGTVTNVAPVVDLNYSPTVTTPTITTPTAAANLLTNGSFESGGTGWTANSGFEVASNLSTYGAPAIVSGNGTNFAELEAGALSPASTPATLQQTLSTVAGEKYVWSLYGTTRTNTTTGNDQITVTTGTTTTSVLALGRGSWTRLTGVFNAASAADVFRITSAGSTGTGSVQPGDGSGELLDNAIVQKLASNDAQTTNNRTAIAVSAAQGLLANDSNLVNSATALSVTAVNGVPASVGATITLASGATLRVNSDGSYTYDPNRAFDYLAAGATATETFTYTMNDGDGNSTTATATMTIVGLTDAATGTGHTATFTENGTAVAIASANTAVADADDTNIESAAITLTNPQTGDRLLVNGSAGTTGTIGTITWTRTDNVVTFAGAATEAQYAAALQQIQFENTTDTPATVTRTINVTVNDGSVNSNTAVATINIDRAPDPVNDSFTGSEGGTISANVATNDTDLGDGGGAFAVVTGPSSGTLTTFNPATGAFVYTPTSSDFSGSDTFTYRYTDADGDTKIATVTLTVNPVNDAPVNTLPAAGWTTLEDVAVKLSGLSIADVDAASGTMTVMLTVPVASGTLTATAFGGVAVSGSGTNSVTLTGTVANINAYLAATASQPVLTPASNHVGVATLTMTTSDNGNTGSGGTLTDVDTRTITVLQDTDADGIANVTDIDDDNDGILDTTEGLVEGQVLAFEPLDAAGFVNGTYSAGQPGEYAWTWTGGSYGGSFNVFDPAVHGTDDGMAFSGTGSFRIDFANDVSNVAFTMADFENNNASFTEETIVKVYDSNGTLLDSSLYVVHKGANVIAGPGLNEWNGCDPRNSVDQTDPVGQIRFDFGSLIIDRIEVSFVTIGASLRFLEPTFTVVRDTDDDGRADHLDIDSDNDGITDNVEAQTTAGYIAPSGTFNVQGLDTAYAAFGPPPGIGPVDTDGDGTADYRDSDSDNDGLTDAAERGTPGPTTAATGASTLANDADRDGLFDVFEGASTTDGFDVNDENLSDTTFNLADIDNDTAANGAGAVPLTADLDYRDDISPTGANGTINATEDVTRPFTLGDWGFADAGGQAMQSVRIDTLPASGQIRLNGTAISAGAIITVADIAAGRLTYVPAADVNGTAVASFTFSVGDGRTFDAAPNTLTINITPVADITDDAVTTSEDTPKDFNVLAGAGGATADNFENPSSPVTSVTQPANGSVVFLTNGTITYTPSANFAGTDTFTYTVTSGGVTETATVTVTVVAVDDAPVNTVPGAQTTSEDTPLVFSSANGNAITVADVDSNVSSTLTIANGTLSLGSIAGVTVSGNGTGTVTVSGSPAAVNAALAGLTFTPTADWNGAATLQISTTDVVNPADVDTISVTVSPVVDIAPDSATTAEDTARTFNVLTNDNFEGSPVVSAVTQPANGSVTIGAGGNVTYTPAANYSGTETFTYTVTSGGVSETTTVTMTVTPVNDAPTVTPAANQTGTDGQADSYNAGALFSDVDNASLSFSASGLPAGLSIDPSTGLISGTIGSHASVGAPGGVYSVTVTATDASGALATTTFTWTIANPAPVAQDDAYTGSEDTPITGAVLANDTDADGDALTVSTTPVSGPSNGTLSLNADGTFTYTPAANFTGTDSFTYEVTDADGATSTATVTLYVNPLNDVPLNTVPGNQTTAEDTSIVFTGANAITVTDPDSATLTTTLSVSHGTLTLGSLAGITITAGADGSSSVTIEGSPAAITAALAGLTYDNTPDYNGLDTLVVTTTDGAATTTANIALAITPVADIVADTVTTDEDQSISFNVLTGTNGAEADSFEGAPAVTGFTQPANGAVTVDAAGNVVYTPNANFNGTDTFSYTVTSGGVTETTTVTVTVNAVNDAPTQTLPPAQNGTEDTSLVFSGAAGNQIVVADVDAGAVVTTTLAVPAGTLTAIATPGVSISGNGSGSLTLVGTPAAITAALNGLVYAPVADANGAVSLTVSTTDGVAAPASGAIAINLAPVADIGNDSATTNEDAPVTVSVLANDTFENAGRTVTGATNGANGTVVVNGDGTVTYTPNANFNGTDSFTYTVTSGGVTETATVVVVVNALNDAPTQSLPAAQAIAEDAALTFAAATGNAITVADLDGDTLTTTLSVTNGTLDLGAFSGVTVSGNGTGTLTITGPAAAINTALDGVAFHPTADYYGAALLSVTTTDGTVSVSGTVALTVTPVVDILADAISTPEDQPITVNVLANDTFENAGAAVSSVTQPAHGTVSIGAGGSLTYTPSANYHGADSFTYTVTSGGVTETVTVTVDVTPVNDAPVTTVPAAQATNEDTALVFSSALANAIAITDIDGDTLTVTLSAANGTLTLGSTGGVTVSGDGSATITVTGPAAAITTALDGLSFAPSADYNGAAGITVTTADGTVTTSSTIAITVAPVVDIVADTVATPEDTPVTINVLTGSGGVSADNFESAARAVTSVTQGASGTVTFLADGTIVYTPDVGFHGVDTFTYTVTSGGVTETTTVTVSVADVNDIPTTTGLADRMNLDGQTVSFDASTAFADADGEALTYTITGLPAGLTYDPATGVISGTIAAGASQSGPYTVLVTASDGHPGGTVSASFTWSVSNPGPTAVNDTATTDEDQPTTIAVLANDTDPDADPLVVTAATAGNGSVTINGDGTITYTPAADFHGTDTIVYRISDGNGGVSTATVTVTVDPVNDAPTTTGLGSHIDSDGQAVSIDVSSSFADLDGDALTYDITGLPPGLSFDPLTGVISGTIDPNASQPTGDQSYTVTVKATDPSGAEVTTSFTWRVLNIPPTTLDDSVTTPEDTPIVASVLANDVDPDGDPLVITHINGTPITVGGAAVATPNGEVSLVTDAFGNQVLIYTPNPDFNGVETLTYTISDGNAGIDTANLTINVTPANDAPLADPLPNLANADADTASVDVGAFFSDIDAPDGDTLTFSAIGLPPGLTIDTATGVISGTISASASQGGPYTVVVTGEDSAGATVSRSFTWSVVNPAPTALDDAHSVSEGTPLTVAVSGVRANDTDPDADPLVVDAVSGSTASVGQPVAGSSGGLFTIAVDGSFTFTDNGAFEDLGPGEHRDTLVTYRISDGNGGFAVATLTVTVNGVNDAPVASPVANVVTADNAPLSLTPGAAFSDVEGDALEFSASGLPAGLSIDPVTGVVSGTVDRAASQGGTGGVYTVTVTADDGNGGVTPVTFTITVTNPAPVAVADTAPVTEDTPASGNVLANDSDPDGDTLVVTGFTVAGVSGSFSPGDTATIPGIGEIEMLADGSYTFTPDFDYVGSVPQVAYTIADGNGGTAAATLDLGPVSPVNDAPVSTPIAAQANNDRDVVTLALGPNFSDIDGDALAFTATGLPPGLSIDPVTGVVSGTIDRLASAAGTYTVTVTATDGDGEQTQQTFSWTVSNPVPTGPVIAAATGVDGTAVTLATGAGFADPDGDPLTFSASGLPAGLSIDPATGTISGTLPAGASAGGPALDGVYSISVTATDSQGAAVTRTFAYTVTNPAPTAGADAFTGTEDAQISGAVGGNDNDPDGDAVTYSLVTGPAHGALVFNADGTFTYTPDADYNVLSGADTFTYRITDANGASATATVTLTVQPVNDAPTAPDATGTTDEETPLTATLPASDVDGDNLTFTKASDPSNGTVTVAADGTYTYTPNLDFVGVDTFTYTISDGNGGIITRTATITVNPVNDAPVANDDVVPVTEDTPVSGNVLGNDTDVDGPALTVTQFVVGGTTYTAGDTATIPGVGTLTIGTDGSFTFTPALNYYGPVPVATYTVTDGTLTDTAELQLGPVSPVNDAPVANDDIVAVTEDTPVSGNVLGNDTDVDGPALTVTQFVVGGTTYTAGDTATIPGVGSLTIGTDGSFTFTPALNYNGPVPVATYTVTDGTLTDTAELQLGPVSPVNDAPVANDDVVPVTEDTPVSGNVLGNDTDVDGDALAVVDTDGDATNGITPVSGPSHGTLVLNADGTFSYTPDAEFHGLDTFTYRISDGNGGFAEATVTLNVAPVNDVPVATDDAITTPEDAPITGTLPPATDVDGDAVTYAKASEPAHGTLLVNADGSYVYTPDADYNGPDVFTYTVSDGRGGVSIYTVTVMVTPVNDPPVARNDAMALPPDTAGTINVLANDTDVDGDALAVTAATAANGGIVEILADGSIRYTPPPGFFGTDTITYTISDGHGGVSTATVTVVVEDPIVVPDHTPPPQVPDQPVTEMPTITADGMVLATVESVHGIGGIAGSLGVNGIVLASVNQAKNLGGIAGLSPFVTPQGALPLDASRIWEIEQTLRTYGFGQAGDQLGVEGLTGFSLRLGLLGSSSDASGDQVVIETLVRDRTLIVQISNTLHDRTKSVAEYRVLQANGEPLPAWLDRAGPDLLIGERPADVAVLKLRVKVLYTDGSFEVKDVEIQTSTGEVQPLARKDAGLVVPFSAQFARADHVTDEGLDELAALLKAG